MSYETTWHVFTGLEASLEYDRVVSFSQTRVVLYRRPHSALSNVSLLSKMASKHT